MHILYLYICILALFGKDMTQSDQGYSVTQESMITGRTVPMENVRTGTQQSKAQSLDQLT